MSLFTDWGLEPIINASGAVTRLGGAPMPAAVLAAFSAAATECVPLDQLQAVASRHIAAATGAEAGLITSGAAAALTLGAAAILTGSDLGRMERLPHCTGFPHEFVVAREHRNGYDHAVRAAGAVFVEVGFHELVAGSGVRRVEGWEYETAFGPQTAGVFYVHDPQSRPPLAEVVARAHAHGLPVLVDAAGELPPRSNLRSILATGADLVAFSGGKAIRGPQATGILCGRRDLIGAAAVQMLDMDDHYELWEPPAEFIDKGRLAGLPRQGIGRGFKVAKEQIAALLVALDLFTRGGHDQELSAQCHCLERIAAALAGLPVCCHIKQNTDGQSLPLLEIALEEQRLGRSALEVCRRLRQGKPPVQVGHGLLHEGKLVINPLHLQEANTTILARRLQEELTPRERLTNL
jgi:L-seryl-tRNA(Ser) seleniumtransferase